MNIRDITAEVLLEKTGQHIAVEIYEIIKREKRGDYQTFIAKYGTDQKLEDAICGQAVRAFQAPAETLSRRKLRSDYVEGMVVGKQGARFWIGDLPNRTSANTSEIITTARTSSQFALPEQVAFSATIIKGAVRQVAVNAYERDPEARKKCVEYHSTECSVCGFNFAARYGPTATGYIHVHPPASIVRRQSRSFA
ncbi:MAG TPA: hypothetical protein VHR66_22895 [Gemmataceae bacterium]|jgi:predicted HNH restriction endonuclease|nr:hypothetical protein [Gemmataceae bacterium]